MHVITSGTACSDPARSCWSSAGFDHHLVKPVQAADLVGTSVGAFEEFAASWAGELT
jgi:hypothetical protein